MNRTVHPQLTQAEFLRRGIHLFALLLLVAGTAFSFMASLSSAQPYGMLTSFGMLVMLALLVPAYGATIQGKHKTKLQARLVNMASAFIVLVAIFPLIGALQDGMQVQCAVIGSAQSCLNTWLFWLSVTLFMPPVLLVVLGIIVAMRLADKPPSGSRRK